MSNFDKFFFDEKPLLVRPALAVAVGLEESIILQQLHYWLSEDKAGHEHEGHKWIYNTYGTWQANFPFLSTKTIGKIFRKLENQGLIIAGNFNNSSYDRTKWYRLDYQAIEGLSIVPNRDNGESHMDTIDEPQSGHSSSTKTTTENTTEINPNKVKKGKRVVEFTSQLLDTLIDAYPGVDVEFQVDLAMNHKARNNYTDMNLYLRNWLNRSRQTTAKPEQANGTREHDPALDKY